MYYTTKFKFFNYVNTFPFIPFVKLNNVLYRYEHGFVIICEKVAIPDGYWALKHGSNCLTNNNHNFAWKTIMDYFWFYEPK